MLMLIMTAAQADDARGATSLGHALDPRPLADGSFALPVAVLSDPAHVARHAALGDLPRRAVAEAEWLTAGIDDNEA